MRDISEILRRIAKEKAHSKTRRLSSPDLRKKLENCYIWSIALYGGECWTVQKQIRNN
jgi:hypothetical protein